MKRLDPEARRVLELASAARTPSAQDRARVARRVAVAVGAASTAVPLNVAHAAKLSNAGKWALVAGGSKTWIGAAALLATALTGYWVWSNAAGTSAKSHVPAATPQLTAAGAGVPVRDPHSQPPAPPLTAAGAGFAPPEPAVRLEVGAPTAAPPASGATSATPKIDAAASTGATQARGPATRPATNNSNPATRATTNSSAATRGTINSGTATRTATNSGPAARPAPSAPASTHATIEAVRATDAQAQSTGTATLDAELDLLHRAQVAWRAREAAGALALLNEHRARFPRSTLQLERDALQVLTLCELGKTADAARLARSVLAAAPHSPLRASLEESCALK